MAGKSLNRRWWWEVDTKEAQHEGWKKSSRYRNKRAKKQK